jgi:hypothetical protein
MGFLLLGIGSLIVWLAVGALIDRDSRLKYAVLFGIADAGAFLIGAQLVSSSLLAFMGVVVAAWLPQVVAAIRRTTAIAVAGVTLLIAAGALFVVG